MITETGAMSLNTATFGIRAKLGRTGLPIAMAIGTGSALGAGLGLTIRHGVLRLIITAVGIISRVAGAGARARFLVLRSMGRLSSGASAVAGSRWALANRSSRGSVAAGIS